MNRRDFVLAAAAALLMPGAALGARRVQNSLAGDGIRFTYRIQLGGFDIGQHTVRVSRDSSGLTAIEHERRMDVKLLAFSAYGFEQASRELWEGTTLKALDSRGVENGEGFAVHGQAVAEGFAVDGPSGAFIAPADLATTESFWVASALEKTHLLSTVKGKLTKPFVRLLDDGRWHLEHARTKADILFDGEYMQTADVDNDGHQVRFERITG